MKAMILKISSVQVEILPSSLLLENLVIESLTSKSGERLPGIVPRNGWSFTPAIKLVGDDIWCQNDFFSLADRMSISHNHVGPKHCTIQRQFVPFSRQSLPS